MAIVHMIGPVVGDLTEFTSSTGTIGTTILSTASAKRLGNYGLRSTPTTTGVSSANFNALASNGSTGSSLNVAALWTRFYFRPTVLPASSEEMFSYTDNTPSSLFIVRINSSGQLMAFAANGTTQLGSTGSSTLSTDTWYRIDVYANMAGASSAWAIRINGTVEISGTDNLGTTNIGRAYFGKRVNRNGSSVTFDYTDILADNAAYPSDGQCRIMRVISNGTTYTGWSASSGEKYTCVDDLNPGTQDTHDSDTSYLTTSTNPDTCSFNIESTSTIGIVSGSTVNCVKTYGIVRDEGGVSALAIGIRSNATDSLTGANDPGASYVARQKLHLTDPNGSISWTTTALDAIEVVVKSTATVAQRCTMLAVLVDYQNPPNATTYTVDAPAPSRGRVGEASENFTFTPDGAFTGTITPNDSSGGGSFTPSSLTWSNTLEAQTVTYTPVSSGTKTINYTNNGGISNPATVEYLATAAESTFYCDLTLSGDGSGTSGSPWQWSQAVDTTNVLAGDIIKLRGTASASITLNSDTDVNGTSSRLVSFRQWDGETAAKFTVFVIDGTTAFFYDFQSLIFDAGSGSGAAQKAFSVTNVVSGSSLSISDCQMLGWRSTLYAGGDFYPYYIGGTAGTYQNFYTCSITNHLGLTLNMDGCSFLYGWRQLYIGSSEGTFNVSNCSFDDSGEDQFSFSGSNTLYADHCIFSQSVESTANKAVWYWPGSSTGTWTGHEGETITQDTSGASGIYVGQNAGNIYLVVDDANNVPNRTTTYVWRLDSDPSNIYFTPSGSGDNSHVDRISVDAGSTAYLDSLLFDGRTSGAGGQCLKVDTNAEAHFTNCIMVGWDASGTYAWLLSSSTGTTIHNCLFQLSGGNAGNTIRSLAGTWEIANCILPGGLLSGGTVTADFNIYSSASSPFGVGQDTNSLFSQDFTDTASANNRYFVDWTNGNFQAYSVNSPQVDTGSASYAPATDYSGVTRPQGAADDIGPYELVYSTASSSGSNSSSGSTLSLVRTAGSYGLYGRSTVSGSTVIANRDSGSYSEIGQDTVVGNTHTTNRTTGSYGVYGAQDVVSGNTVISSRTTGSYGSGTKASVTESTRGAIVISDRTADSYGAK